MPYEQSLVHMSVWNFNLRGRGMHSGRTGNLRGRGMQYARWNFSNIFNLILCSFIFYSFNLSISQFNVWYKNLAFASSIFYLSSISIHSYIVYSFSFFFFIIYCVFFWTNIFCILISIISFYRNAKWSDRSLLQHIKCNV